LLFLFLSLYPFHHFYEGHSAVFNEWPYTALPYIYPC
jgi:hypothetical protein